MAEKKTRTKTLHLPRGLFDAYDVEGMVKQFLSWAATHTAKDSDVWVTSIRVGRTQFQVN